MPRKQNVKNQKTEKKGIKILKDLIPNLYVPDASQKRRLYDILKISSKKYSRSFDAVILNVKSFEQIKSKEDFTLIEIKTTGDEKVTDLPYGVFFGITQNEEHLFKSLDNYQLCIVHTGLNEYVRLDFKDYESLIQNKRTQYQVNFRRKPKEY